LRVILHERDAQHHAGFVPEGRSQLNGLLRAGDTRLFEGTGSHLTKESKDCGAVYNKHQLPERIKLDCEVQT
jgi:hypothetical protein